MKKSQNRFKIEAEANAVLKKRKRLDLLELISLIHDVNPTGRDLNSYDENRLYDLKSELQNFLIHHHQEGLEARVDSSTSTDFVLLWSNYLKRDACHARVEDLDDEAQSWVTRSLDEQEWSKTQALSRAPVLEKLKKSVKIRPTSSSSSSNDPLRPAHDAMREYDYASASELFYTAFKQSASALEVVVPFLEHLIETMGAYQRVLELEPELSTLARKDERVRFLFAVAARKSLDLLQAEKWLSGLRGPEVAQVFVELAQEAVVQEKAETADRLQRQARKNAVAPAIHLACDQVQKAILGLRSEQFKPLEEELEQAYKDENVSRVETLLSELLSRVPSSLVGRRILHQMETLKKVKISEQIKISINQARDSKDLRGELNCWKRLKDLDLEDPTTHILKIITDLETLIQEEVILSKIQEIKKYFDSMQVAEAVLLYLDLKSELRREIIGRLDQQVFLWAEKLADQMSNSKNKAVAESVAQLHLVYATRVEVLSFDELEIIELRLKNHLKTLSELEEGNYFLKKLQNSKRIKKESLIAEDLKNIDLYLAEDKIRNARALLDNISPRDLPAASQTQWEVLSQRLISAENRSFDLRSFEESLNQNKLFDAKRICSHLKENSISSEEKNKWNEECERLQSEINEQWSLRFGPGELPLDFDSQMCSSLFNETPLYAIDPTGQEMVLILAFDHWIFIRCIDLENLTTSEVVFLRCPKPFALQEYYYDGNTVVILGEEGAILKLRRRPWSILNFNDFAETFLQGKIVDQVLAEPTGQYISVSFRKEGPSASESCVLDIELKKEIRNSKRNALFSLLMSPLGCQIFSMEFNGNRVLLSGIRGEINRSLPLPRELTADSACAHPVSGQVILATHQVDFFEGGDDETVTDPSLELLSWVDNTLSPLFRFSQTNGEKSHWMVPSRSTQLLHVCCDHQELGYTLNALEIEGSQLKLLYQNPAPSSLTSATSLNGEYSTSFYLGLEGLQVVPLNRVPVQYEKEVLDVRFPNFDCGFYFCGKIRGPIEAQSLAFCAMSEGLSHAELKVWINSQKEFHQSNSQALVALVLCLDRRSGFAADEFKEDLLEWLASRHLNDPWVLYLIGSFHLKKKEFHEAKKALESLDFQALDPYLQEHFAHMLGITLYLIGDFDRAFEVWRRGSAVRTERSIDDPDSAEGCGLEHYLELDILSVQTSRVTSFLLVLSEVDQLMEQKDFGRAMKLLLLMPSSNYFQLQVEARRVQCLLEISSEISDFSQAVRKIYFIAKLRHEFQKFQNNTFNKSRPNLPRPLKMISEPEIEVVLK